MLPLFETARPGDDRPRRAIELVRAWARGEVKWAQARDAAFAANAAAREVSGAARWQRARLPDEIRELVLDDQRLRNARYWSVFDC